MTAPLYQMTARELVHGYRYGSFSPVEAASDIIGRMETLNPELNAFCFLDSEATLDMARQSEARWQAGQPIGPLDGVPVSIKDLLLARGWPTRRGSRTISEEGGWPEDSPPVARLREAGAVFLGKTTTPEFAWKGVTDSPLCGITRNPLDLSRTPGGSSGGASAAVAAGLGPIALGTDAGGSLRIPAAFCGLFTIKPTTGRVPSYPSTPYGSFAATGPITQCVRDAACALTVLSRPDQRDWSALPANTTDFSEVLDQAVNQMRIGWSMDLGFARPYPVIRAAFEVALERLESLGAELEEVKPPFSDPSQIYEDLRAGMTFSAFRHLNEKQFEMMDPGLVDHIRNSRKNASLENYLAAEAARAKVGQAMGQFHDTYDALVTPAVACPAFEAGIDGPADLPESRLWSPYTFPFNLTGQPAVTLPCGNDANGLPLAFQLVGPRYGEANLLRISLLYETAYPWLQTRQRQSQLSRT